MKFWGKMWLIIISKVTKNQGFNLSLEGSFFQKAAGVGGQNDPPSSFRDKISNNIITYGHETVF